MLWYVGVILLFYRNELNAFLGGKPNGLGSEALPHRWDKGVDTVLEEEVLEDEELMGRSKMPEGMEVVETAGISFASNSTDKVQQIGLVADVLQELKEVFAVIARQDGNKSDFFGLMEMVRQAFPAIGSHPNIGQINAFITAHAPFHLSPEELENLWD